MKNILRRFKKKFINKNLFRAIKNKFKSKLKKYRNLNKAKAWFRTNFTRIRLLFEDYSILDFILEPFKAVIKTPLNTLDSDIYLVITEVAIVNAVLAGLPGKMGIGVWVSVALEVRMAYIIARHVGVNKEQADIWVYFKMLGIAGIGIYSFRTLIGLCFSAFSIVLPGVNPIIIAELFVTDFIGIYFLIGFEETKNKGKFPNPKNIFLKVLSYSKKLFLHQFDLIKGLLSIKNLKLVYKRLKTYLLGEIPVNQKVVNGETFSTAAMAYLISDQHEKLKGPLGEIFIDAIRKRWSSQFDQKASIEEIAEVFREYDNDQIEGVINTIKGKMFENLIENQENLDGDIWFAEMHNDETFPGSDIIFTNADTAEKVEVSLKAVSVNNNQIIENALSEHPDIPIMTTEEVSELYPGDSRVLGSPISNETLIEVTESNYNELVEKIKPIDTHKVIVGGITISTFVALWPFVVAYLRNRISQEQLEKVFKKILGKSGVKLVSRLVYATILGPLFAWYLLARGVKGLVDLAEIKSAKYLEFKVKS